MRKIQLNKWKFGGVTDICWTHERFLNSQMFGELPKVRGIYEIFLTH